MQDVLEALGDAITPGAIAAMARDLGLDREDARRLVVAVAPVILERLAANANHGAAGDIASALNEDHDGSLLDVATDHLGGSFRDGPGSAILGHVFGTGLDGAVTQVAATTGLPEPAVRLGFQALAPVAMAAITKAALGAVTAVVVVKLLDVAVDGIRTGKAQRMLGGINRRLDGDHDGNAADDVGRGVVRTAKRGGAKLVDAGRKVRSDPRVRSTASKAANRGKRAAGTATRRANRTGRKLLKKWFGR